MLIDAGSGTKDNFFKARASLDDLQLIALSHLHPDHSAEPSVWCQMAEAVGVVRVRKSYLRWAHRACGTTSNASEPLFGPSSCGRRLAVC